MVVWMRVTRLNPTRGERCRHHSNGLLESSGYGKRAALNVSVEGLMREVGPVLGGPQLFPSLDSSPLRTSTLQNAVLATSARCGQTALNARISSDRSGYLNQRTVGLARISHGPRSAPKRRALYSAIRRSQVKTVMVAKNFGEWMARGAGTSDRREL